MDSSSHDPPAADPTSAHRALLEALDRLRETDPGAAAPALRYEPLRWAAPAPPDWDLAAMIDAAERGRAGDGGEVRDPRMVTDSGAIEGLPPPLAPAAEIAAAVNAGELDVHEVCEAALRRAAALGPRFNAFATLTPDRARSDADVVDGVLAAGERPRPLAGVPVAHKDILLTAGIATSAGSALLEGYVPEHDASVVAQVANAGTLLVGKSATHEFATGPTGTVAHRGPTTNPWSPDRMAGGSSAGSAAALAAGIVAAATGTDTGGSIRIPAACCGVVGLKPTYGRVSRAGVIPFAWSLDHVGPLARNVRDVALLLNAMAGHDPLDPGSARDSRVDFVAALEREGNADPEAPPLAGLRIALLEPFVESARTDVARAVRDAAVRLEDLGARRVDVDPPPELRHVAAAAIATFLAEGYAVHGRALARHPDLYQGPTRAFLELGRELDAHLYLQAQRLRTALASSMARLMSSVDVLVCPTLPITAPPLDAREIEGPDGPADVRALLTTFTRPFNLTGQPALSLPCGHDEAGLPIGLQLVGRPFDEAAVLRAGHAYESSRMAEAHRWPPGCGREGTA